MPSIVGGSGPTFPGKQGSREKFLQKVQADLDKKMKEIEGRRGKTPKTIGKVKPVPKNLLGD